MTDKVSQGFAPIVGPGARVLVLGSLPSRQSIADQQYYAHPQNQFWPIMDALVGASRARPYSERVDLLKRAGIAVWDVLHESVRPGSMDSAINTRNSVANDLQQFLLEHRDIVAICFNGQTAAKIFDRQIRPSISIGHREIIYYVMPSTSPAYASISLQVKQQQWSRLLDHL